MNNRDYINFSDSCIISKQSFEDINNLYKLIPMKEQNIIYYYNKKRNCDVIKKVTDKLLNNTIYLLNKNWYRVELYATNSETLQKVGKVTPELHYILNCYNEYKEKEKHQHGSLLDAIVGGLDELLAIDKT